MKILEEITVPKEIVNDVTVTVIELFFTDGQRVEPGDKVASVETTKMNVEIFAREGGYIRYFCCPEEDVKIGQRVARIYETPADLQADTPASESSPVVSPGATCFSRRARELIETHQLSLESFSGKDFVSARDVEALMAQGTGTEAAVREDIIFQKPSRTKRAEIENLAAVQGAGLISMVSRLVTLGTTLTRLQNACRIFNGTVLLPVLQALPEILPRYRELNAFYQDGMIGYYQHPRLGLAVNLGEGLRLLTVPEDLVRASLTELETAVFALINRYLDKTAAVEELSGSTFVITDLAQEGVDIFLPLIPNRQSAILGLSAVDAQTGQVRLTVCFDHRVLDGQIAAQFLRDLASRLEDPAPAAVPLSLVKPAVTGKVAVQCGRCLKTLGEDHQLGGPGLIKVVNAQGREVLLCANCLAGY